MDRMLFWRLETERGQKVCRRGDYDYYSVLVNGYRLTYAKNRWRPDGRRLYVLGDELAKAMGFMDYADMRQRVRMQYHRGMLSPRAMMEHFK